MEEHCCEKDNKLAEKFSGVAPDEKALYDAAELLKVFGDSTRLRIIFVLCQGEKFVCDIAAELGMTQ